MRKYQRVLLNGRKNFYSAFEFILISQRPCNEDQRKGHRPLIACVQEDLQAFSESGARSRVFLLVNGNYTNIAYPDAQTTYALAINDNGDVVGTYASGRISNGFLWKDGTFTTPGYEKGTGRCRRKRRS